MDQTGLAGRPSRRARAQVSYKEPSLATKMRRPGKELVDAVLPDSQRRSVGPQPPPSVSAEVYIKQESDSSWKPVGAIGGRGGEEDGEMGSPLRQKLDRREGNQDAIGGPAPEPPKLNSAAASNAISAMINETSAAKRKVAASSNGSSTRVAWDLPDSKSESKPTASRAPVVKQEQEEDLAIFDFNASSPVESTTSRPRIDLAKAARNARRHSSVPASAVTEERRSEATARPDGALPSVHKRTGSGGIKSSSTTSLGKSTAMARASAKERKASALPASGSGLDLRAKVNGDISGTGSLRAERAASRRKSMML